MWTSTRNNVMWYISKYSEHSLEMQSKHYTVVFLICLFPGLFVYPSLTRSVLLSAPLFNASFPSEHDSVPGLWPQTKLWRWVNVRINDNINNHNNRQQRWYFVFCILLLLYFEFCVFCIVFFVFCLLSFVFCYFVFCTKHFLFCFVLFCEKKKLSLRSYLHPTGAAFFLVYDRSRGFGVTENCQQLTTTTTACIFYIVF